MQNKKFRKLTATGVMHGDYLSTDVDFLQSVKKSQISLFALGSGACGAVVQHC